MVSMHQFYLDRAAQAGADAASCSLANARDRHLVAELSWADLAARAGRHDANMKAREGARDEASSPEPA